MNNSTPNTPILDDDAVLTWLETRSVDKSLDYAEVDEILRRVPALCATVRALRAENERLKRGEFTAEEFQNLCHNIDIQAGLEAFADGCEAYQEQLFGRCRKGSTT